MARYLSPEWVQSFDDALSTLDLSDVVAAAGARSLAAADGTFSVVQVVTGVPPTAPPRHAGPDDESPATTDVRVVLTVADGRARLGARPERGRTRHGDDRARLRRCRRHGAGRARPRRCAGGGAGARPR